jgi:uncharacterized membrane protein
MSLTLCCQPDQSEDDDTPIIVGVVIGALLLAVAIIVVVAIIVTVKFVRRSKSTDNVTDKGDNEAELVSDSLFYSYIWCDSKEAVNLTPSSSSASITVSIPSTGEITDIDIKERLGGGNFSDVFKGE